MENRHAEWERLLAEWEATSPLPDDFELDCMGTAALQRWLYEHGGVWATLICRDDPGFFLRAVSTYGLFAAAGATLYEVYLQVAKAIHAVQGTTRDTEDP